MDAGNKIKKEFGEINFDNPIIIFRYQRIDVDTKASRITYINIIAIFLAQFIFFLTREFHFFIHILLFIASFFLIYRISSGLNKIEIDFFYKRIRVKNEFLFIRIIRKILRLPATLPFDKIADINNTSGIYYGHNQTRYFLIVRLINHQTIRLAHFESKEDCLRVAQLLKRYIIDKPN